MRVEIVTEDRVGITHDILAVYAQQNWNIVAMEVLANHVYIQFDYSDVSFARIESILLTIDGVVCVKTVPLLPAEKKSNHLNTLLSNIPDPIIDIDQYGVILLANSAAISKDVGNGKAFIGSNINNYIDLPLAQLLISQPQTVALSFNDLSYFAEVTPVINQKVVSGAVIVLKSLNRIGQQLSAAQQRQDASANQMVGDSVAIKLLQENCRKFADLSMPVLISGETGTGKELLARAIHQQSQRADKPFLAINCAALPENLLESELFGYDSGAFSGASHSGKPGLFELGDGGTIFLDEIAEMPLYLQAKLLRFIQDYCFRRVGGTKVINVDVRIVSASHQNLAQRVTNNQFREDLFYRLNVLPMHLPALRERKDDIPALVMHFCAQASQQFSLRAVKISEAAIAQLTAHVWPGNIRQLQNVIFRAAALSENGVINDDTLGLDNSDISESLTTVIDWQSAQQHFEKKLLAELLPLYPTTRKLAKRLNVSHNKIAMKLRQYELS